MINLARRLVFRPLLINRDVFSVKAFGRRKKKQQKCQKQAGVVVLEPLPRRLLNVPFTV